MSSNGLDEQEHRKLGTRRRSDKALVKALTGACAFLFVVTVVAITYIVVTTTRVDSLTSDLKKVVCVQNAAYRAAYSREVALIKSGPPAQAKAHRRSAATLKVYLDAIDPLVKCEKVDFKLPPDPK
jgi:hypothetical protein